MKPFFSSIVAPLLSISFLMLSIGYFLTFITLRIEFEGGSDVVIGAVQSAFYAGMLIGAMRIERMIRRIGHIRTFAAFACVNTISILVQALWYNPYLWFICRFAAGSAAAAAYIVIESWLLSKSTTLTRGRILSCYMVVLYASQALSQFILTLFAIDSVTPFILSAALASLCAIPLAITYSPSPKPEEPSVTSFFSLFKESPFGFVGCFAGGIILSAIYAFTPLYAKEIGLSVPLAMFLTIAGGFLLQWPIGLLSDVFDRRRVLMVTAFAVLVPCVGILFAPVWALLIFAFLFILGGVTFTIYPLGITHVCDRVQPHDITAATGVLLVAYGIGASTGALMCSPFVQYFSIAALFVFIGAVALILAGFGLYSMVRRPVVPLEDQNPYVLLPRVSQVAYELDPRANPEEGEEGK